MRPAASAAELVAGCDSQLYPNWYGAARDAAERSPFRDPDDTAADLGAYGGLRSGSVHWADTDVDGWPTVYDCAPLDAGAHPEATDPPYDGLDQDCRGDDDYDADDDGERALEYGGLDCDDTDPQVRPGAKERLGNGRDDDCDGWADDTSPLVPSCNQAPGPVGVLAWFVALLGLRYRSRGAR